MIKIVATICAFAMSLSACFGCSHIKPKIDDPILMPPSILESSPNTTEILPPLVIGIHGSITDQTFTEVNDIIKKELAGGAKEIKIVIDSGGGSVSAGRGISEIIEFLPVPSICVADGEAASMAFYILQSCTIRQMTKRTVLMIHNPIEMVSTVLTTQDIKDLNNDLQSSSAAMLEQYTHRMKVSKEYVAGKIDHNKWFLTWQEALEVGAVDEVLPVPSTSNPTENTDILRTIVNH